LSFATQPPIDTRRRFPRAPCSWVGRMTTTSKQQFDIKVKNISIGGAAVQAPCQLKLQDKVLLEFTAQNQGENLPIQVIARVVFIVLQGSAYDIGTEFVSDTNAFRDFINTADRIKPQEHHNY